MLTVVNHRFTLTDSPDNIPALDYRPTPNVTPRKSITPCFIVVHYTASGSFNGTIAHCCNPKSQVSYHLIIDRDGALCQLAPFTARTWHAGASFYDGRTDLNSHSIGIGLMNWGVLNKKEDGTVAAWLNGYTHILPADTPVTHAAHKSNPRHKEYWESYPAAQLCALEDVVFALFQSYPVHHLIGHDDCAPGRKVDPGPAFFHTPLDIRKHYLAPL